MESLQQEIEAANQEFMRCYAANDMTALSNLYTVDCKLMPTGVDVQEGRDSVAGVFQGVFNAGAINLKLVVDEVGPLGAGDTAYERSHYTFYNATGEVFDEGKYVVIWKKIDGRWYLYTDIFNTNKS